MSIICFVEECNPACAANEYHATLLMCGLWTSGTGGWWGRYWEWWCRLSRRRSLHGNELGRFHLVTRSRQQTKWGIAYVWDSIQTTTAQTKNMQIGQRHMTIVSIMVTGSLCWLTNVQPDACTPLPFGLTRRCFVGSSFRLLSPGKWYRDVECCWMCDGGVVIYMRHAFLNKRTAWWDSVSQRFMLVNIFLQRNNRFDPGHTHHKSLPIKVSSTISKSSIVYYNPLCVQHDNKVAIT